MASFEDTSIDPVNKLFLLGHPGSGKTGAVLSLAAAGYNVRILDLDNGVQVMRDYLLNPASPYRKARAGLWTQEQADTILSRVRFETLTDKRKNINGILVPAQATVWTRAVKLLEKWKTDTDDFGPISTWTPKDVLVIDSLTLLSKAAFNWVLAKNARLGQRPHESDYGLAQGAIQNFIETLYDSNINCNVIYNCHIKVLGGGEGGGLAQGHPETIGRAISPTIGRYVNTILLAQTSGMGQNTKRKILTNSTGLVELKTTAPLRVKPEYPLETGLLEYFLTTKAGEN